MNSLASLSLKGLTGHWTKYGGNVHDIFERQNEEILNWYCQSCGGEQDKSLTPYYFEHPKGEYIKICNTCMINKADKLKIKIEVIETTIIQTSFDETTSSYSS